MSDMLKRIVLAAFLGIIAALAMYFAVFRSGPRPFLPPPQPGANIATPDFSPRSDDPRMVLGASEARRLWDENPYTGYIFIFKDEAKLQAYDFYLRNTYNSARAAPAAKTPEASRVRDESRAPDVYYRPNGNDSELLSQEQSSSWPSHREWFSAEIVDSGLLGDDAAFKRWKANAGKRKAASLASRDAKNKRVSDEVKASFAARDAVLRSEKAEQLQLVLPFLIGSAVISLAIYFLPTFVAKARKKENFKAIFVCNLLAAPTFGICWVVAMVWAFTDRKPEGRVGSTPPPIPSVSTTADVQLRNLANLKTEGLITEEEFQIKRTAVLQKLG